MRRYSYILPLLMLLLFCGTTLFSQSQKLMINELVAKNELDIRDETGHHEDWVEIYNPGKKERDLGGLFITDNIDEPEKWRIPDLTEKTKIPAKGYLVLFLDGHPETGLMHCNVKLSRKGESVFLFDRDGKTLVDSVTFPKLPADVSWSRIPDGGPTWGYVDTTTAEGPNPSVAREGVLKKPKFSLKDGFYNETVSIAISTKDKGVKVYVTTDGTDPTQADSLLYKNPIEITKTTVLRARAFKENWVSSQIATKNYFLNEVEYTLPVIAVTVDHEWLWGKRKGLFVEKNKWRHTQRPAHVAYYTVDRKKAFSLNGGIKLQGRFSRNFEKKSFTITAGQRYGNKEIEYKIFEDIDRESFDGLVVRADCNYAGYDETERWWGGDRIRNELIYNVNKEMGSSVIMQAYQPAILYINGEYWGLYNLMERKNKDFIEKHYPGVGDIDMINPAVERDEGYVFETYQGDGYHFRAMEDYIKESDMSQKEVYDSLCKLMDMPNFIDGWVYEIYTVKGDPTSNSRIWRPRTADGKWQSIAFDWDHWKEQDREWIYKYAKKRRGKSWLFAQLILNEEFQVAFINRLCDYLNTTLSAENVRRLVWEIHERVDIEKKRDRERWKDELEFMPYEEQIMYTINFAEERPGYLYSEMSDFFELGGPAEIELNVAKGGGGVIRVSTLEVDQFPWKGTYMQDIPIKVEAVAMPGYKFSKWSEASKYGHTAQTELILNGNVSLTAHFESVSN